MKDLPYLLSILYGYDVPSEGLIERKRNFEEDPVPDWTYILEMPAKTRKEQNLTLDLDIKSQGFQ